MSSTRMPRIYLCMGPHCRRRGAAEVRAALEQMLQQTGLRERVECIDSGCQDRCKLGPNLLVQPGGYRWHSLTPHHLNSLMAFLSDTDV